MKGDLTPDAPPPMFAVAYRVHCSGDTLSRPRCAHFKKQGASRQCDWYNLNDCTNPIARVQAHFAALKALRIEPPTNG